MIKAAHVTHFEPAEIIPDPNPKRHQPVFVDLRHRSGSGRGIELAQAGNPRFLVGAGDQGLATRSEEHTSELQSLMRISYAVFCLKKNKKPTTNQKENKLDPHMQ